MTVRAVTWGRGEPLITAVGLACRFHGVGVVIN